MNAEYTNMIKIYGESRGSGKAARRIYANRFPNLGLSLHGIFGKIDQRL